MKKISVVIPVYNIEGYINACADSVLSQDYENLELLLVDDGSSDRTPEICREYVKKDPRVRFFEGEHRGVSAARNQGLREAGGDYIMLIDGDDFLLPGSLSHAAAAMPGYDLVSFPAFNVYPDGSRDEIVTYADEAVSGREFMSRAFAVTDLYIWHRLCDGKLIRDNDLYFDESITYAEDVEWMARMAVKLDKIRYIPEGGYCYRKNRPGSSVYYMFDKNDGRFFDSAIRAYRMSAEVLKAAGDPAWEAALKRGEWHVGRKEEWLKAKAAEEK